jgi:putative peptidoglycan binding protein/L,D-transpeptidase-like protein
MSSRLMTVALGALVAIVAVTALAAPAEASTASVKKWQTRLNALHCDAGPVDGRTGTWTRSAIIRFQSRHALAQTGAVNPATRQRLFATNAQRCDVRRVPARSGSGRRIVISQKQNWVWVIGAANQVLRQGGIVDNPGVLRKGTYRTGSYCGRAARVKKNTSGSLWLDNFVRFAPCGIGFHRIPRAKSDERQIHADHILGTNLATSHGCIRLSAGMATRIWDFTAAGRTTVRVL